jgi:hypothetical protein
VSPLHHSPAPTEWEYLLQSQKDLNVTGGLPERGQEKWELVAVEGGQDRTYYFKRPKAAANPMTARILAPTGRWEGRFATDLAKQPMPEVKGPKTLAAVWKTLQQPGDPPAVDFSNNFVLAASTTGNSIEIIPVLYRNGEVRVSLSFASAVVPPEKGAFLIIAVPRKDVKSLDGKALRAPGPED